MENKKVYNSGPPHDRNKVFDEASVEWYPLPDSIRMENKLRLPGTKQSEKDYFRGLAKFVGRWGREFLCDHYTQKTCEREGVQKLVPEMFKSYVNFFFTGNTTLGGTLYGLGLGVKYWYICKKFVLPNIAVTPSLLAKFQIRILKTHLDTAVLYVVARLWRF